MKTDDQVIDGFLQTVQLETAAFSRAVDHRALKGAKRLILDAQAAGGRVHVTGIGKPAHVAGYGASLLSSTGTPTYELNGTECVHGSAGQVRPGDAVIAISNSGETVELKATVSTLKSNGAKIIALTGHAGSWLAREADIALIAGAGREGDPMNKPPRASIIVESLMLQTLSLLLQESYELTPEQYVRWHPGGSLGALIRAGG